MTNLSKIILLAIVQGIAEFLPISSSGHIVVLAKFMQMPDVADVNIVLHGGTLLSILVFYYQRVLRLLKEDRRVIPLLIVGTIPAVIVGLPLKKFCEHWLESPLLAGCMLVVTGGIVWAASKMKPGSHTYRELGIGKAILIGMAQAVAILPGISRSGSTIAAGIASGMSRTSAATFSFLLAIPAIAGASVLELKDLMEGHTGSTRLLDLSIGAVVAFFVGILSLWWLVRMLEGGKLHYFAFWCVPFGALVICWQLFGA